MNSEGERSLLLPSGNGRNCSRWRQRATLWFRWTGRNSRRAASAGARLWTVALGGLAGGAVLGTVAPLERILFHSYIYGDRIDMLLHAAWSTVVCSVATLVAYSVFWSAFGVPMRWLPTQTWRVLSVVGGVTGAVALRLAYGLVFSHSKFANSLAPNLAIGIALVFGSVGGAIALPTFNHVWRHWPKATWVCLAILVSVVVGIDLHRYLQGYGNVHLIISVALLLVAGFSGSQIMARIDRTFIRPIFWGWLILCGSCVAGLARSEPTPGARTAVLLYGGVEKTVIRHILWPVFDQDRDGFASASVWGSDCDDKNSRVHPLTDQPTSPSIGCRRFNSQANTRSQTDAGIPRSSPPKSVVLILVDTLRRDAAAPFVRLVPGVTNFTHYQSCGSDTKSLVSQLLGKRGCRPEIPNATLVSALKSTGRETAYFIHDKVQPLQQFREVDEIWSQFEGHHSARDEVELLEKASNWIQAQDKDRRTFFALLHLWGSHAPYRGAGATDRERYLDITRRNLALVAKFVNSLSSAHLVIIMGDHGEEFHEHDSFDHGRTLYNEVLATPLLIRSSRFPPGEDSCSLSCPDLISMVYRTAVGIDESRFSCNRSSIGRFAYVDAPSLSGRGPTSSHLRSMQFPDGRKIIWNLNLDIWELYDLNRDPGEKFNIATIETKGFEQYARELLGSVARCNSTDG